MVYEWLTKHVMKWDEINNMREWGRFKVHHKADRNEFLSAFFRYTDNTMYKKIAIWCMKLAKTAWISI